MTTCVSSGDRALAEWRTLDVAKGVLITLRRCSGSEAFRELVATADACELGVLALCRALVNLAEDRCECLDDAAADAARRTWGSLLTKP